MISPTATIFDATSDTIIILLQSTNNLLQSGEEKNKRVEYEEETNPCEINWLVLSNRERYNNNKIQPPL